MRPHTTHSGREQNTYGASQGYEQMQSRGRDMEMAYNEEHKESGIT